MFGKKKEDVERSEREVAGVFATMTKRTTGGGLKSVIASKDVERIRNEAKKAGVTLVSDKEGNLGTKSTSQIKRGK
jgi:hypothetical protein